MACRCAIPTGEGWQCEVSGDSCMFFLPNSKACAEMFGEGPDSNNGKGEDEDA